jgi:hypothetical protein
MVSFTKGKSPFYPGQPVPAELFVGRAGQIERILSRGAGQVASGKPVSMFVQGEYGIGKSSIAGYAQSIAERKFGLHAIYAPLGGAESIDDVGARVLEATIRSGAFDPKRSERIRELLAKYIGEQYLFGVSLHADALKKDAPSIASGLLPFLGEVLSRLRGNGVRGIFLTLDEINGITSNPKFSHFIKAIVDTNAMSPEPLPLLLMLCGVEERRREMITHHQPVDRIFDIVDIGAMTGDEMRHFFSFAFDSVQMRVDDDALNILTRYSAGFPKIMHLVGDAAYWIDRDGVIDANDARDAVLDAADEVGRKYVDQQVYKALRSEDYHSILDKIAGLGSDRMSFRKAEVASNLTETEKKKFNNFLQKMKSLKVLKSGDVQGEYIFNVRMVRLYIWLQSLRKKRGRA